MDERTRDERRKDEGRKDDIVPAQRASVVLAQRSSLVRLTQAEEFL
jgi:hypothetical protein